MTPQDKKLSQLLQEKLNRLPDVDTQPQWERMEQLLRKKSYWSNLKTASAILILTASVAGLGYFFSIKDNLKPQEDGHSQSIHKPDISQKLSEKQTFRQNNDETFSNSSNTVVNENVNIQEKESFIVNEKNIDKKPKNNCNDANNTTTSQVAFQEKNQKTISNENMSENKTNSPQHSNQDIPEFHILSSKPGYCEGEIMVFKTDLQDKNFTKQWLVNGEFYASGNAISIPAELVEKGNEFKITLIVQDIKNKETSTSQTLKVDIYPLPEPEIKYKELYKENEEEYLFNPYWEFETSRHYKQIEWQLGQGEYARGNKVQTIYKNPGIYEVKLTVVDNNGCKGTAIKKIYVDKKYDVFAPNAFTPDQDGLNDEFIPKALENTAVEYLLEVSDSEGNIVFRSNELNKAWNGKMMNIGDPMPEGTYFWTCIIKDKNGKTHQWNGQVLLLREKN